MTSEIERFNINETKMPELQKCSGCKCKMLLSFFDIIENTGQLKKTCRKCLERNKINHDLVKYGNSVIYKIFCKDESITECYVGSTTDLNKRIGRHKSNCNIKTSTCYNIRLYKYIRDHGNFDNWNFEILEDYPCRNKESLVKRERYWFEKLGTTLNSCYPERNEKEWKQTNKKRISEVGKQYYQKNKEQIREKDKKYREKNKEKISNQRKEKVECPCGSVVRKSTLRRHERSQKHQNYLK
jgi:group I intron endonuclease